MSARYCVDGALLPAADYLAQGEAPEYAGDGEHAPFRVFDIQAQAFEREHYETRADADRACLALDLAHKYRRHRAECDAAFKRGDGAANVGHAGLAHAALIAYATLHGWSTDEAAAHIRYGRKPR
jgi:hypothetical protein